MIDNLLIKTINEGVVVTDSSGVIRVVNPALEKMFGYREEELIGEKIEILIPPELRKVHVQHRESIKDEARSRAMGADLDLQARKKDGSTFYVEVSLNPFVDERGKWMLALVSDISIRKKAEQQLQISASFLKEAEKLANVAHYEINTETGAMTWSDHFYRLLQVDRNEIAQPTAEIAMSFVHPDDKENVLEAYRKSVTLNEPYEMNFRVIRKDGEVRNLNNTVVVHEDRKRKMNTLFGVIHDVTEQRRVEESLRELNADLEERVAQRTRQLEQNQFLYKMIARNFPTGNISVFDENLNYIFVEGKELFKRGITSEMLIGTSFLDRVDPAVRDDIEQKLREVQKGRNLDFELSSKNRTYFVNAVGMPMDDSGVMHILMVTRNITAQKQAEIDIKRALEKEQMLNELKSRFVSMASHEFRTPLTSILNSVSLISKYIEKSGIDDETAEKQRRHLDRIKKSTKHLTSILNDFLSIDKLEHGKIEIVHSQFDITEFANDVIQDMDGLRRKDQQIEYRHAGERIATLDRQMLMNIFNNLLSNAVKYSKDDGVVLMETRIENATLTARFKDQGIGIPKEDQNNLFDRFFRAKNVSDIQGTGLGLNIVKNYVEFAGGSIELQSEENVGTEITIILPLQNRQN